MNLANCPKCGKLFVKGQHNICPACLKIRYVEIQQIKGWISATTVPKLENIEKEIFVSAENFKEYLADGWIKPFNKVIGNCEKCGIETRISTRNILCDKCIQALKHKELIQEPQSRGFQSRKD